VLAQVRGQGVTDDAGSGRGPYASAPGIDEGVEAIRDNLRHAQEDKNGLGFGRHMGSSGLRPGM
jgi:hypothetical protein